MPAKLARIKKGPGWNRAAAGSQYPLSCPHPSCLVCLLVRRARRSVTLAQPAITGKPGIGKTFFRHTRAMEQMTHMASHVGKPKSQEPGAQRRGDLAPGAGI